jgi:CheY-like chemotaxis protein
MQTVLIIEDDAHSRHIYSSALLQRGYTVLTADYGADGVHAARLHRPNLILLDVRLPVLDGWSVLRYLRAFKETRKTPIVGMSAYPLEEDEQKRFDQFLAKPIGPKEVILTVEAWIGPPEDFPPSARVPSESPV